MTGYQISKGTEAREGIGPATEAQNRLNSRTIVEALQAGMGTPAQPGGAAFNAGVSAVPGGAINAQSPAVPGDLGEMAKILAGSNDPKIFALAPDIFAAGQPKPHVSKLLTPDELAQQDTISAREQREAIELERLKEATRLGIANRRKTPGQLEDAIAVATAGRPPTPAMPTAAVKLQGEHIDALGTATGITSDLASIKKQVDSGGIDLGPFSNFVSRGLNTAGQSTEQSRNFGTFMSTLNKLRNDSLRLNNGVQTEGDAQRAWDELFASLNDKKLVSQRLSEIGLLNERAVNLRKLQIDTIRNNFGAGPFDYGLLNVPSAVGAGGVDAESEKERLRKKYGLD